MAGPKPFFGADTPKRRPLPMPKGAPQKGAPPSFTIEPQKEEEPEDLGPEMAGNHPRFIWIELTEKTLPQNTRDPIVIYMPNHGIEYCVVQGDSVREDFLRRKDGRLRDDVFVLLYGTPTAWAYLPRFGEVPF